MFVTFRVLNGVHVGQEFLVPGPQCLIGRASDCYIRLKSEAVSRHHCMVYIRGGDLHVRDINSRNGTFVNGLPVRKDCNLNSGDELRVGGMSFEVQILDRLREIAKPPAANCETSALLTEETTCALNESDVADWLAESRPASSVETEAHEQTIPYPSSAQSQEGMKVAAKTPETLAVFKPVSRVVKIAGSWSQKPRTPSTQAAAEDALRNFLRGQ